MAGEKQDMTQNSICRFLDGGAGVGKWSNLQESPFDNATSVFEPIFWFPEVNISQVAIDIDDMAELPAKLRAIPAADVRRMQSSLAEAQPFFRYRCGSAAPASEARFRPAKLGGLALPRCS